MVFICILSMVGTPAAVFIRTGKVPATAVIGNYVQVTGTVNTFPSVTTSHTPATEIDTTSATVLATGQPLPAPVVITASMLRFPELKSGKDGPKSTWANEQDLEVVLEKMRIVMRAVSSNGIQRVVLGAWGCGAYGNPVKEIARAWRIVLLGNKGGRKEEWKGVEQVVFAITDGHMADVFSEVFADALTPDTAGPSPADIEG